MIYDDLKKGLALYNEIKDKERRVNELKTFASQSDHKINVSGIEITLPKATLNAKFNTKIKDMEDELDTLKAEFDAL